MAKEPRDSGRKNELITSHRILIDIYRGKYEMKRKFNRKNGWRKNVITMFKILGPLAKAEHEVL